MDSVSCKAAHQAGQGKPKCRIPQIDINTGHRGIGICEGNHFPKDPTLKQSKKERSRQDNGTDDITKVHMAFLHHENLIFKKLEMT